MIRMLPSLAYLPPQYILRTFKNMKIQIPPDALPLYNYFENTFVRKSDEFGYHDPPLSLSKCGITFI